MSNYSKIILKQMLINSLNNDIWEIKSIGCWETCDWYFSPKYIGDNNETISFGINPYALFNIKARAYIGNCDKAVKIYFLPFSKISRSIYKMKSNIKLNKKQNIENNIQSLLNNINLKQNDLSCKINDKSAQNNTINNNEILYSIYELLNLSYYLSNDIKNSLQILCTNLSKSIAILLKNNQEKLINRINEFYIEPIIKIIQYKIEINNNNYINVTETIYKINNTLCDVINHYENKNDSNHHIELNAIHNIINTGGVLNV